MGLKYIYDVWNRIVKVENSSSSVLETYTYDAMGRRITETPTGQTTKDLYFNTDGNVIEEQQAGTTTNQYVWGLGYQNSLVLRDDNSTSGNYGKTGSGLGRRTFVQQDANWNVTSLVDPSGNVQERFVYDPYGRVQVVDKSTWNSSTDSFTWIYHFQGGRQDPISGLVHFGTPGRDYSTTLGRWTEQDPAGYIDGMSLYQFVHSAPCDLVDPLGLDAESPTTGPTTQPATNQAPPAAGTVDLILDPKSDVNAPWSKQDLGPITEVGGLLHGQTHRKYTVTVYTVPAKRPVGNRSCQNSVRIVMKQHIFINSRFTKILDKLIKGAYGHEQRHVKNGIDMARRAAAEARKELNHQGPMTKEDADNFGMLLQRLLDHELDQWNAQDADHKYGTPPEPKAGEDYPVDGEMPPESPGGIDY